MHPFLIEQLAKAKRDDFIKQAHSYRISRSDRHLGVSRHQTANVARRGLTILRRWRFAVSH